MGVIDEAIQRGMRAKKLEAVNKELIGGLEKLKRAIWTSILHKRIYKGVAEGMLETIEQALAKTKET